MEPRPDRARRDPELARDLVDAETHHRAQDHGLSRSPGESLQGLDDVEVIRVGRLTALGDGELTVAFLEQITAPAVGGEVPHHTACPGLRVVMVGDSRPVLPDANEHLLNEILRVLLTTGEQKRLSDETTSVGVKEQLELLTPLLVVHRAPRRRVPV
jgi:hypothetical protein